LDIPDEKKEGETIGMATVEWLPGGTYLTAEKILAKPKSAETGLLKRTAKDFVEQKLADGKPHDKNELDKEWADMSAQTLPTARKTMSNAISILKIHRAKIRHLRRAGPKGKNKGEHTYQLQE
jgi:hypothetical protein